MADMEVDPPVAAEAPKEKKGKDSSKKRFEVKKVRLALVEARRKVAQANSCSPCSGMLSLSGHGVRDCTLPMLLDLTSRHRHRRRQLCHLPKPHHGPL